MSKEGKTKGYIYKLYSKENPEMIYIGSTSSSLKDRLNGHFRSYKRWKKLDKGYLASYKIFEKYGTKNIVIEKMDKLYFKNQKELLELEGEYQRKTECVNIVTNGEEKQKQFEENPFKKFEYSENNPFKNFCFKNENSF